LLPAKRSWRAGVLHRPPPARIGPKKDGEKMQSDAIRELAGRVTAIVKQKDFWWLPLPEIGMPATAGENLAFQFNFVLRQWDTVKLSLCVAGNGSAAEVVQGKIDAALSEIKTLWGNPPKPGVIDLRAFNAMRRLAKMLSHLADEIDGRPGKATTMPSAGDWLMATTLADMANRLGNVGIKKARTMLKGYDLKQAGNRQSFTCRLDTMPPNMRAKLEQGRQVKS